MALDMTPYPVGMVPDQLVRNLFAQETISEKIRLRLAALEMTTVLRISMMSDNPTGALAEFETLLEATDWPATAAAKKSESYKLKAVWSGATVLAKTQAEQQLVYAADPSKIPTIPESDRLSYRAAWIARHPGHELHEHNEPHPRFVDRLHRDWRHHSRVMFYELLEMRVLADKVITRSAWATTAESLLQAVKEDMPGAPVNSADQALERLHAFFVGLGFCNIWPHEQYLVVAMPYINKLKKFYRDNNECLLHLTKADSKIRKAVNRVMMEDLSKTYAAAFAGVLKDGHHYWDSAKLEADSDKFNSPSRPGTKRGAQEPSSNSHGSPMSQSAKRRQRKANAKPSPSGNSYSPPAQSWGGGGGGKASGGGGKNGPKGGKASGKGGGGGGKSGKSPGKSGGPTQLPAHELEAIMTALQEPRNSKVCKFFNSSRGCNLGDGCRFTHKCCACGAAHPMVGNH